MFEHAYHCGKVYFRKFLTESVHFCCRNWLFGAKQCRGPAGAEFIDLVTSVVVYMSGSAVDSLLYSLHFISLVDKEVLKQRSLKYKMEQVP